MSAADAADDVSGAVQEPSGTSLAVVRDDGFERFWSVYPRHEAKKRSRSAWRQLTKADRVLALGVAEIMGELVRRGQKERRFVPMAPTFINGKRWEDWRDGVPAGWESPGNDVGAQQAANLAAAVAAANEREGSR